MENIDNQKVQWERSYQKKENFLFYPHEEIIRFFSKYIYKRKGLNSFEKKIEGNDFPKVLDLGCGIGRHIIFAHNMNTDAYGIDLSEAAIAVALEWAEKEGITNPEEKIIQSEITNMPFEDNFFDFVVSHGVLDSMSETICKMAIQETHRVMKQGARFYCDLVSGDDDAHAPDFSGEEVVRSEHEKDTIQLYFNEQAIEDLFSEHFDIEEKIFIKRHNLTSNKFTSRYHIVLVKR